MDCITEDFKAALRSLDKRNHYGIDGWGNPHEKLEDILPPNDWRLKAIKAFRGRIKINQVLEEEE